MRSKTGDFNLSARICRAHKIGPVNGQTKNGESSSLEKVINQVPPSEDRIGFIGCGIMGTPMALNLKKTGHNVSVYNRTHTKTQPLRDAGITVYETLRQVIENCDIVFGIGFFLFTFFSLLSNFVKFLISGKNST